jgi:hypothetical protein
MRRILNYHLSDRLHLRITQSNDQLIEYEELLDFISRAQDLFNQNSCLYNKNIPSINGKKPVIPSIYACYILPSLAKPIIAPQSQSTPVKLSPLPPSSQSNNTQGSTAVPNDQHLSLKSSLAIPSELCPISLHHSKIEGDGWVQINNVYLPFIMKNHQRLVPYQVLVSCKILEPDELRSTLTRATSSDITLINSLIRDCKINSEQIPENALLVNVYHVLIGTKNLVYVKLLPKDNPTSKINRQYKSVLVLNGGFLNITTHTIPFVCSNNHSFISLNDILTIYPNLQIQFKSLARVPRTNEFDYLQLIQMYSNEKEFPLDTLLIDIEDLNQKQIIPSKKISLIDYHAKEKTKLEQQIALLNNSTSIKRKCPESHENRPSQPRSKLPSTTSSHTQPNNWLSANNGHRGRTRWQ